jgi:sarcosine oxidase subunit delta
MRLHCPHCGPRAQEEFAYYGDGTPQRPDPAAADADSQFYDYVYLRDNSDGAHRELWYHASGCQTWLIVERNTRTHAIVAVASARNGL